MKRYNIRMAGIGGQGVVTASHVMSNGVIIAGGESTLVPFFGSEKRMAPVESYVRVAEGRIFEIGEIIYPNVIMIFHTQVITHGKSYTMPFYSGLKDEGVVLINSETPLELEPDQARELREKKAKVFISRRASWLPMLLEPSWPPTWGWSGRSPPSSGCRIWHHSSNR